MPLNRPQYADAIQAAIRTQASPDKVAGILVRLTESRDQRVQLRAAEAILRLSGLLRTGADRAGDAGEDGIVLNLQSVLSNVATVEDPPPEDKRRSRRSRR